MITLLRRQAHALRAVLRRSVLGIAHRRPVAPIVFSVVDGHLRARYRYAHLAIEHATPARLALVGLGSPCRSIALAEVGRRRFDPCPRPRRPRPDRRPLVRPGQPQGPRIHRPDLGRDRRVSRTARRLVRGPGRAAHRPGRGASRPGRRRHPVQAMRWSCSLLAKLLDKDGHEVVATDGRQVLIRGGPLAFLGRRRPGPPLAALRLPGTAPRSPLGDRPDRHPCRAPVRPLDDPAEIQTSLRASPGVDMVFPAPDSRPPGSEIDPAGSPFLAERWAGCRARRSTTHQTVDLTGQVVVRASPEGDATTELVLRDRATAGPRAVPDQPATSSPAVRLGFGPRYEVVDPSSPIASPVGSTRPDAWQPLDADSAIAGRGRHPDRPHPTPGRPGPGDAAQDEPFHERT